MYQPPYKTVYREIPKPRSKPTIYPMRKPVALTEALLDVDDSKRSMPVRFHVEARSGKHLINRTLVPANQ